ncbi:MAG: CTP synthetase [Rhodobacterales bacterium]|nr:MAG: CTP synthetase [Rhodobacterales bacterium]
MSRLVLFLGSMIGSTLAFVLVVAALVAGIKTLWPLLGAAFAGYLVSWPIAVVIAQRMK